MTNFQIIITAVCSSLIPSILLIITTVFSSLAKFKKEYGTKIFELKSKIFDLEKQLKDITNEKVILEQENSKLRQRIKELEEKVKNLEDKQRFKRKKKPDFNLTF